MSSSVFHFSFFVYHDMAMLGSVTICSDTPSHVAVNHVALVLVLAVEIAFARRLRFASLHCSVGQREYVLASEESGTIRGRFHSHVSTSGIITLSS
jgi:hypothetical protein